MTNTWVVEMTVHAKFRNLETSNIEIPLLAQWKLESVDKECGTEIAGEGCKHCQETHLKEDREWAIQKFLSPHTL